jgi:hypothetical protein
MLAVARRPRVRRSRSRRASPRRGRERRKRKLGRHAIDVSLHTMRATVPNALHGRCRHQIRGGDVGPLRRSRSGCPQGRTPRFGLLVDARVHCRDPASLRADQRGPPQCFRASRADYVKNAAATRRNRIPNRSLRSHLDRGWSCDHDNANAELRIALHDPFRGRKLRRRQPTECAKLTSTSKTGTTAAFVDRHRARP